MYTPPGVDSLTWLAFQLPSRRRVETLREQFLKESYTDDAVFEIALAAQATGATEWLNRVIQRDLEAPEVHRAARALTLIAALDEGSLLESLRHHLDGRVGFLEDVAKWARARLELNRRARTWFGKFLECPDAVEAWAAFRLFLRCVDRRFYLWRDVMLGATPDLPLLWRQQVAVNDQDIRRAAEKNEGRLSETLFGVRISQEIAPWCGMPPMVGSA